MLLRVVDLETTGLEPPEAAVCEIGCVDVIADAKNLIGDPVDWRVLPDIWSGLVDPGHPIPAVTSAVHHIIDEDVLGAAPWSEAVENLLSPIAPSISVLVAHSAKFERQFITDELTGGIPWICTYKCALRLWPDAPSHSNQALRYWRRPTGLNRAVANVAHRAGPDAYVTAFHLRDMLTMAPVEKLIEWSAEPALQVRCHIGKWRGTLWADVDFGFLEWVAYRDFDEDILFTVRHEMQRRHDEWEKEHRDSQTGDAASLAYGEERPF